MGEGREGGRRWTLSPGRLALRVAYDGSRYLGFQRQARGPTVQETLEEALSRLAGGPVGVHGAGRTDAGVHAWGQVVHCEAALPVPLERLPAALNSLLPRDVAVTGAAAVPEGFHARYHARGKIYRYLLWRREAPSPFLARYAWHCRWDLDLAAVRAAAALLVGTHDFRPFSAVGTPVRSTVRTLRRLEVAASDESLLLLELEADGFLYRMARRIVGTLVRVGRGRLAPEAVTAILAGCGPGAGPPAPARGLCLMDVLYEPPLTFVPEKAAGLAVPFAPPGPVAQGKVTENGAGCAGARRRP